MKKAPIEVQVIGLYLAESQGSLVTSPQDELMVNLAGLPDDSRRRSSFTKRADSRDPLVPSGALVRNWPPLSAVSLEELEEIARKLKLGDEAINLAPLLGANLLFSGISNFTQLPRGSLIVFPGGKAVKGAILQVEAENEPCIGTGEDGEDGEEIAKVYPFVKASSFRKVANGLRGVATSVYTVYGAETTSRGSIRRGLAWIHQPG